MNRFYLFLVTSLLLFAGLSFAQEQLSLRQQADKLYGNYEYAKAALIYQKLTLKKKADLRDLERLASCYRKMNDYEAAEKIYSQAIQNPLSNNENLLAYGEVLKANGNYSQAKQTFQQYAQKTGDARRVAIDIAGCDSALIWLTHPAHFKVTNEAEINTKFSEFSTFLINNKIYYAAEPELASAAKTYGWTGNSYLKVYTAERAVNHRLSKPLLAEAIFNKGLYHEGPLISNNSGTVFYLTRTYFGKNKSSGVSTNVLELYTYTKSPSGEWTATPFLYNGGPDYSVGHAALSKDEHVLYFVSDKPGGLGGTDIWFCELQSDGTWGTPQNAGPEINTVENEMFPVVGIDNTLYFSTNGLPGMGSMDIFSSVGSKNKWTKPVNLKHPINSSKDDFSFLVTDSNSGSLAGYFSSNRKGGKGGDDIYSFICQNAEDVSATENIAKKADPSAQALLAESIARNNNELRQFDTVNVLVTLHPVLRVGATVRLKDIYYDLDRFDLREDAEASLKELIRTLTANPAMKIELSSHTDSRGNDGYNMQLSQRRAQSVVDYLISMGINKDRLIARGYGETRLLNRCANDVICSETEQQENRRTEFTILAY